MTVSEHLAKLRRKRQISPQGIFAYLLLAFSNLLQGLLLFKSPQRILLRFKQKILKSIENKDLVEVFMKRTRKKGLRIRQRLRVGTYMFVLAILDMYGSYAFSLFVVLTHLGWSTFQLFRMRFAPLPDCVKAHLNEWRFGQILPMILLIAPLYSMITFYAQQIWSDRHSRTKGTGNGSDNIPQPTQPSSSPSSTQAIISDVTLEQDPERNKLHHEVYNTIQFKYVLGSFCFLSVGSVVGFFAQFAYNLAPNSKAQGYHNIGWADTCFSLFPDIIATGCGLTTRLIISIVPLFFSKRF
jgi:hypothetical protein